MKHITNFQHSSLLNYEWKNGLNNFSFNGGDLWLRKKIDYVQDIQSCILTLDNLLKTDQKYKNFVVKESRFSITYSFPDPNILMDYIKGSFEPNPNYLGVKLKDFK